MKFDIDCAAVMRRVHSLAFSFVYSQNELLYLLLFSLENGNAMSLTVFQLFCVDTRIETAD